MASSVEVNGSRSIAAHIAPMPIPMAGARFIPHQPVWSLVIIVLEVAVIAALPTQRSNTV